MRASSPSASKKWALSLIFWLLAGTALASDPLIVPEAGSGFSEQKTAQYPRAMAVTANPLASEAAAEILRRGGSAVDAAITAQLVLGLVEPQSSGIGGGAFMLHWDAEAGELSSWNGRETAPQAVNEAHFLDASGKPMGFFDAVIGGHAVGVPGVLAMLEASHRRHGVLAWATLFEPAIALARGGFAISPRLHTLLEKMPKVAVNAAIREYFFTDGQPKPVGHVLKNPAYADSLAQIAQGGSEVFYRGRLAQAIVTAVQSDPNRAGVLSLADMASYRAQRNQAVCAPFLAYQLCGAPPPSSGGTTVLATLGMMAALDKPRSDVGTLHVFIEASRLAFADRNHYIADPDFVAVPTQALVAEGYLRRRAALIDPRARSKRFAAGQPAQAPQRKTGRSPELPSTSHFSIVDAQGNVVSMTTSIETAFGSRVMVGGFLLNNQLTDFSFAPEGEDGDKIANRIAPGKRPRSSMSPMMVFKDGRPVMALGSPGGSRIIPYVALSLYRSLALAMPLSEAISAGHVVAIGDYLELESGRFDEATLQGLTALGQPVKESEQTSGLHGIVIRDDHLEGSADPRREGSIAGF